MNDHKNLFIGLAVALGLLIIIGIPVIYFVTKKNPAVTTTQDTSTLFGVAPTSTATTTQNGDTNTETNGDIGSTGPGPVVTFTISSQTVTPGSTATLVWSAEGATLCSAGGAQDSWFFTGNATAGSAQTSPITNDKTFTIICSDDTGATTVKNVVAMIPHTGTGLASGSTSSRDVFSSIINAPKTITKKVFDFFSSSKGAFSTLGDGTGATDGSNGGSLDIEKADISKLVSKETEGGVVLEPVQNTINSGRQATIKLSTSKMVSCKTGPEREWGTSRLKVVPIDAELKTGPLSNKIPGTTSTRSYDLTVECTDADGIKTSASTSIIVRPAVQFSISFPYKDIPDYENIDKTTHTAKKYIASNQRADVSIKALNAASCTLNEGDVILGQFEPTDGSTVSVTPSANNVTYTVHCEEAPDPNSEPGLDNEPFYTINFKVVTARVVPTGDGGGIFGSNIALKGTYGESCFEMLHKIGYAPVNGSGLNTYEGKVSSLGHGTKGPWYGTYTTCNYISEADGSVKPNIPYDTRIAGHAPFLTVYNHNRIMWTTFSPPPTP